jgi:hypothetical protein
LDGVLREEHLLGDGAGVGPGCHEVEQLRLPAGQPGRSPEQVEPFPRGRAFDRNGNVVAEAGSSNGQPLSVLEAHPRSGLVIVDAGFGGEQLSRDVVGTRRDRWTGIVGWDQGS